jgi:hypothetical protein
MLGTKIGTVGKYISRKALRPKCVTIRLYYCDSITTAFQMNISGTLNIFRLLRDPTLCLPQHTVSTFNHLPIPLSKAFKKDGGNQQKEVDIQAVVLDKDNCFAVPHTDEIHKPYEVLPRAFASSKRY